MSPRSINKNNKLPKQLLSPKYWLSWFGLGLFYIISLLPIGFLDFLGVHLGRLLAKINHKRYEIVRTNLSLCFPDKNTVEIDSMVNSHFEFLMRSLMHYGIIWWGSKQRLQSYFDLQGFEQVKQIQDAGNNVIILLSHCTGLEFAVSAITQNFESSGPYKPLKNPVIDWMILRARQRFGCLTFTREEGLRPIVKQARKGRVTIYLADEDLGPENSVFAPFFNVQKATIPVLGRLADLAKARVLPAFSCYDPLTKKYRITLFSETDRFPTMDQQVDTELMNKMIEKTVQSCPTQYFWTLKFFKTRPDKQKKFYQ